MASSTRLARESASDQYAPKKEDKFSFGLWTVGNRGRDPFGDFVRPTLAPVDSVKKLSELGAWGINLHDNDLVPFDATLQERDRIVREFKQALNDYEMVVPMATTNLFFHPVFKDGAFTAVDPSVRALALQKTMKAIDLGVELGASTYVFWGGREGVDAEASKDPVVAIKRMRDAINFVSQYVIDQGYKLRLALEPKPNEPRSDTYLPTIGHMLAFIYTLDHPDMVGLNPEVAHEYMANLKTLCMAWPRLLRQASCSISTLTIRRGRVLTRTCALAAKTLRTCSSWSSCWRIRATTDLATSMHTRTGRRMKRGYGILRSAACVPTICSKKRRGVFMPIRRYSNFSRR